MKDRLKTASRGAGYLAVALTISPSIAFAVSALAGGPGGGGASWPSLLLSLLSPATLSALRFSLGQAALSTGLALIVGFPGAYFVARYNFRGRRFFLSLAAVPFCLPPILVILSFILYYGKNGWLTLALARFGLDPRNGGFLYSLWGLVFVHAFYNFPIVIQNVGAVWTRMPRSREEAARTLGAGRFRSFAAGTLPYLLPSILQAASLVFLFCFFSFTIVLVFGGLAGTTLEVGIYRAIRFTSDAPKALALSLIQSSVALLAVWAFAHFDAMSVSSARGFGSAPPRLRPRGGVKLAIILYQAIIAVFFLGPLLSLGIEAFTVRASLAGRARFGLDNFSRLLDGGSAAPLWRSISNSLALSGSAAVAATLFGLAIGASLHYGRGGRDVSPDGGASPSSSWITALPLAMSPAIIAAGWSALLDSRGEIIIVIGQTALAWPFVARSLQTALAALDRSKNEAARTLGSRPFQALAKVDLPAIAPSIASAAAFAFSLTMGDANIPLVLGGGSYETLPLLLYRLTSSYRFSEACAVGLVLALFTSVAFFLKERNDEAS